MFFMNRKSKIKHILITSLILAFLLLAAGCKHNLTDNSNSSEESSIKYVILKLNLGLTDRQASPSLDEDVLSHLEFKVTAKNHSTNKKATTEDDPDFFVHNQGSDNPYEYKIKLDSGNDWDVTVTGYYGDPEDNVEILKGDKLVSVQSNGSYFEEIELFFITTNTGNVDLKIDVTAVPEIANLTISQSGNRNLNGTYSVTPEADGKRIIHITPANAITAGNFSPILSFCNADDVTIISIPETITVTKNMTTKYWFKSSKNPFLSNPDENGYSDFVVTRNLISQSLNTIFYISGNSSIGKASNSGNDYSNQLYNLDNAFKRINAINNNDYGQASNDSDFIQHFQRNFIIFVSEKAVAPGSSASPFTADHPLNLSIYPIGTKRLPVTNYLKVGRNINLTMENLTINNEFTCDDNSTVLAENVNFSKQIAGHAPASDTTNEIHNTSLLTMTGCTIAGAVNCYASSDGQEKCSITATNCTFNNSLTNKGNIIATDTNFDKNYTGSGNSSLILVTTDSNSESNYIKGSVTLEDSASAIIRNTNIGAEAGSNSINIKNTSSAILENVEITKNVDAQSSITFLGNTHFTGDISSSSSYLLSLKDGVVLKIGDMLPGTSKLAAIKVVASPSSNLPVIEAIEGQEATLAHIKRFELHNPGYYLDYDAASKKGLVKLSWGQIQEPTFGGCTISFGEGSNITSGDDDILILARGDNPQSITVKASDSAGTPLVIKSVKQYLGNSVISSAPDSTTEQTEKTISFQRSMKETYGLEIRFIYDGIEYGEMFTVKIQ